MRLQLKIILIRNWFANQMIGQLPLSFLRSPTAYIFIVFHCLARKPYVYYGKTNLNRSFSSIRQVSKTLHQFSELTSGHCPLYLYITFVWNILRDVSWYRIHLHEEVLPGLMLVPGPRVGYAKQVRSKLNNQTILSEPSPFSDGSGKLSLQHHAQNQVPRCVWCSQICSGWERTCEFEPRKANAKISTRRGYRWTQPRILDLTDHGSR